MAERIINMRSLLHHHSLAPLAALTPLYPLLFQPPMRWGVGLMAERIIPCRPCPSCRSCWPFPSCPSFHFCPSCLSCLSCCSYPCCRPSLALPPPQEVGLMAERIINMRSLLRQHLEQLGSKHSWKHITDQVWSRNTVSNHACLLLLTANSTPTPHLTMLVVAVHWPAVLVCVLLGCCLSCRDCVQPRKALLSPFGLAWMCYDGQADTAARSSLPTGFDFLSRSSQSSWTTAMMMMSLSNLPFPHLPPAWQIGMFAYSGMTPGAQPTRTSILPPASAAQRCLS